MACYLRENNGFYILFNDIFCFKMKGRVNLMKRIIFLLCVVMIFGMTACGGSDVGDGNSGTADGSGEKAEFGSYLGSVSGVTLGNCLFITDDGKVVITGENIDADLKNGIEAIEDAVYVFTPRKIIDGTYIVKKDNTVFTYPAADKLRLSHKNMPLDDVKKPFSTIYYAAAITSEGKVVTSFIKEDRAKEVATWENIVKLAGEDDALIGITKDKKALVSGENLDELKTKLSEIGGVVDVCEYYKGWLILKDDGKIDSIISAEFETLLSDPLTSMKQWEDIVQLATGGDLVAALKSDGTVVLDPFSLLVFKTYGNKDKKIAEWEGINTIFSGGNYLVGVKNDGTVVAEGYDSGEKVAEQAAGLKLRKSS